MGSCPEVARRAYDRAPDRCEKLLRAIHRRDFAIFASVVIADASDVRELCQQASPPLDWWGEASDALIKLCDVANGEARRMRVGDAASAKTPPLPTDTGTPAPYAHSPHP